MPMAPARERFYGHPMERFPKRSRGFSVWAHEAKGQVIIHTVLEYAVHMPSNR